MLSVVAHEVEPKPLNDKLSVSSIAAKLGKATLLSVVAVMDAMSVFFILFLRTYNVEDLSI
ncbi:hypothetical protein VCHENC02_2978 [Vibrio harveyi]|uniref:Uncharacterized protein n=1 Tax=Vibrio harveyi TaxID=669 RepID=A0A454CY97_VIBHA|nr:hypothetical protein VCHENC02_2978 [Vibrio harveyi]